VTGAVVDLNSLRKALVRVLEALEQQHGMHVPLALDHYWHVAPDVAFDPYADAAEALIMGQLSEDVREVESLAREPGEPVVVWHDLAHLSSLLAGLAAQDRPHE
jgi:hypothetical protein